MARCTAQVFWQRDGADFTAHEECYIANSVTSDVRCEPVHAGP